ncbi:MAG: cyclic nucleotide-binding protein, partial [Actinoplanes sp.]
MSVWEALAGRAPGEPLGPADPGLWGAVVDRLNPARARPVLRAGIEAVELVSVRGTPYVMLRSPDDGGRACYLRLTPEEWQLAGMMDGTHTVARLVAEFARLAGRLAPDQVRRVVADLAGNRMLDELPMDAFRPLQELERRPLPQRVGTGVLAAARGRRMLVFDVDRLITGLYRAGGRLLFTKAAAIVMAVFALAGIGLFVATWWRGSQAVFLANGSYLLGAVVLLLLNLVALASHELGHALATKHAGREVPAAGVLVYF